MTPKRQSEPGKDAGTIACDIAVVGAGAAGLTAALVAANMGASVAVIERSLIPGGWLLNERRHVQDIPAYDWVTALELDVQNHPGIRLMYGHTCDGAIAPADLPAELRLSCQPSSAETPTGVITGPAAGTPFAITARHAIMALGASERGLEFDGCRRPGVYAASHVRRRHGAPLLAGRASILVFTDNDSGYLAAIDLVDAGFTVSAIVDRRRRTPSFFDEECARCDFAIFSGASIARLGGWPGIAYAHIHDENGKAITDVPCNTVVTGGGLVPVPIPKGTHAGVSKTGACAGLFPLRTCLSNAAQTGASAALGLGFSRRAPWSVPPMDRLLNSRRVTGMRRLSPGPAVGCETGSHRPQTWS